MKKCPLYSLANKLPSTGIASSIGSDKCQPSCGLYEDSSNLCSLVVLAKIGIANINSRRLENAKDIAEINGITVKEEV